MSSSDWEKLLPEGKRAVEIVRLGLINRGINAGESIITEFGNDEDIPVYSNNNQHKLFWISVKSVSGRIENPHILPVGYKGWMCGEIESKQWLIAVFPWVKYSFDLSPNLSPTRREALNLTPLPS